MGSKDEIRRLTEIERNALQRWLQATPLAWEGWPTFHALDREEQQQRMERLKKHGCPVRLSLATVNETDDFVAFLRNSRRGRYTGQVNRIM